MAAQAAVPSVQANSFWFHPRLYWQGPSWVNMNWLIIEGLERYGYKDHAAALRESTIEMVEKNGCSEYFDPHTGEAAGAMPMVKKSCCQTRDSLSRILALRIALSKLKAISMAIRIVVDIAADTPIPNSA